MEEKETECMQKDLMHRCIHCNYYNCPYLTEEERTRAYHYEEYASGLDEV